ncbi:MAG: azurin [Bacteroidia bacterium]|nr:azurin [Bacteroidia bacterium]MCO5254838.1 azurin [Bacteroidota bacterium]MCZ2130931.1 azurin [Bacteroidia bacterium]
MKKSILTLASVAFLFAACNNTPATETTETTQDTTATTAPETPAAPAQEEAAAPAVAEVTIEGNDQMKFNLTEIKVKEGQTVKLTLNHVGKAPKAVMGHNLVILASGVDMMAFSKDAISAKATDYIPEKDLKNIIAHTKLIGGGESDVIEFQAPAKGTYDFLCSFPGHSALMKGKFIVE